MIVAKYSYSFVKITSNVVCVAPMVNNYAEFERGRNSTKLKIFMTLLTGIPRQCMAQYANNAPFHALVLFLCLKYCIILYSAFLRIRLRASTAVIVNIRNIPFDLILFFTTVQNNIYYLNEDKLMLINKANSLSPYTPASVMRSVFRQTVCCRVKIQRLAPALLLLMF